MFKLFLASSNLVHIFIVTLFEKIVAGIRTTVRSYIFILWYNLHFFMQCSREAIVISNTEEKSDSKSDKTLLLLAPSVTS